MAVFKVVPVDNDPRATQKKWAFAFGGAVAILAVFCLFVPEFRIYLDALRHHYWTLMTGAASLFVTAWDKVRSTLSRYACYGIALAFVFVAGFQAWQDQHSLVAQRDMTIQDKLTQLNALTVPDFRPHIDGAWLSPFTGLVNNELKTGTLIVCLMTIQNHGAPSAIAKLLTDVVMQSQTARADYPIPPSNTISLKGPNGAEIDLNPSGNLSDQSSKPIPTYGATSAWFLAFVPYPVGDVNRGQLKVTVVDYRDKEYSAETTLGANGDVAIALPSAGSPPGKPLTPNTTPPPSTEEQRRIQLAGDIIQTVLGGVVADGKNVGIAFIQAQVRNIGHEASVADGYELQLKCPNHIFKGNMQVPTPELVESIAKKVNVPMAYFNAGFLPNNSSHPIAQGGESRGWLLAFFPDTESMTGKDTPGCQWVM